MNPRWELWTLRWKASWVHGCMMLHDCCMYIYSLSLFLLPFLAWVPPPRIHKRSLNVVTLCIWWFDQHLFHPGLSSSNWAEVVEQLRESTKLKGKKLLLPVRLALTGQCCLTCCTGGCFGTAIYNSKSASGIFWDRDRYWTATVVWCGDPGCNCLITSGRTTEGTFLVRTLAQLWEE